MMKKEEKVPKCPFCGSMHFETEIDDDCGDYIAYDARCLDCGEWFRYVEFFTMYGWSVSDSRYGPTTDEWFDRDIMKLKGWN